MINKKFRKIKFKEIDNWAYYIQIIQNRKKHAKQYNLTNKFIFVLLNLKIINFETKYINNTIFIS